MKSALAEYLRQTASWPGDRAREYPEDARNERSSAALAEFAAYVESLPDDDLRLQGLAELGRADDGIYSPGETAAHVISRYGFYRATHSPSEFLDWILEEEKREAAEMLEEERRKQLTDEERDRLDRREEIKRLNDELAEAWRNVD